MDLSPMNVTTNDENFRFLYWNPCIGAAKSPLDPAAYPEEKFYLLQNGSFYLPFSVKGKQILNPRQYCLAAMKFIVPQEYLVIHCEKKKLNGDSVNSGLLISLGMIVSIPFLLATWLVYTLIKELRNLHGFVLRAYIVSLTVSYTILSTVQIVPQEWISNECCIFLGKLTIKMSLHLVSHLAGEKIKINPRSSINNRSHLNPASVVIGLNPTKNESFAKRKKMFFLFLFFLFFFKYQPINLKSIRNA